MILSNTSVGSDANVDQTLVEGMIGDPSEMIDASVTMLTECHNLTIAMARFEHANYLSEATAGEKQALEEGAIKEFFIKAKNWIVDFFKKMIAWIKNLVDVVWHKVFTPRETWLKAHKGELEAKSDVDLKGTKVSVGTNVEPGALKGMFTAATDAGQKLIKEAEQAKGEESPNFQARIENIYKGWLKNRKEGQSVAASTMAQYVGEPQEHELSRGMVGTLIDVAETTFANVTKMKGAQMICDGGIRTANGTATAGGDEKAKQATLKALQAAGPAISSILSAIASANSAANQQAMSALVKALHAKAAAAATPAAEPVSAGTSLLDAYF